MPGGTDNDDEARGWYSRRLHDHDQRISDLESWRRATGTDIEWLRGMATTNKHNIEALTADVLAIPQQIEQILDNRQIVEDANRYRKLRSWIFAASAGLGAGAITAVAVIVKALS